MEGGTKGRGGKMKRQREPTKEGEKEGMGRESGSDMQTDSGGCCSWIRQTEAL